jgi:hypothetical protein
VQYLLTRLAFPLAFVVFLTGSLAMTSPATASTVTQQTASKHMPILFRPHQSSNGSQPAAITPFVMGSGDLSWGGGPVQASPRTFVIFWGSNWQTSGALNSVGAVVNKYFNSVGATSFENILTQYSGSNGAVRNTHTYGGFWIDTTNPPSDTSCGSHTVQDSAIQNEVNHAISVNGWPNDTVNTTYFVYTPSTYFVNDGFGDCSEQVFCAYHNYSNSNLSYAAMAYPISLSGCGVSNRPNGSAAGDSLVNVTSHEQFEAITDPQAGNGWLDAAGFEIGDKCAWDFSLGLTNLQGNNFELQSEYSNATHSCVKSR